jgi:mono/diheme cytochrome c family protein
VGESRIQYRTDPEEGIKVIYPRTILATGLAAMIAGGGWWALAQSDTQTPGFLPYTDAAIVADGARLYAEFCAACHGVDLAGEPEWQVRGADGLLPAPPHDATGHTWHHPDAMLFAMTRDGVAALIGNGYESAMIGFGDVMTDDQIIATLAYIKSTWPERVIEIHDDINRQASN